MKAVLLVSHGSRFLGTEDEIRGFVGQLKCQCDIPVFEYAFLDIAHPSIPEGIDLCVGQGATEVVVLLNFLNAGRHVDEDIPYIVNEARVKYPGVKFYITKPIGRHDQIINIFLDMINTSGQ